MPYYRGVACPISNQGDPGDPQVGSYKLLLSKFLSSQKTTWTEHAVSAPDWFNCAIDDLNRITNYP